MFALFYAIPVTLFFFVGIGFCVIYLVKAFVLFRIGLREDSSFKKQSAIRTCLIAFVGLTLLIIVWAFLIIWIFSRADDASDQEPTTSFMAAVTMWLIA